MARTFAVVGALAFGALVAAATPAQAQDRLNFTGSADLFDVPESGGALLFIDFLVNGSTGGAGGTVTAVETINGAFDPEITPGTTGTITDLVVSSTGVEGTPVSPFVSIGGYTFTLTGAAEGNAFGPISLFPVGTSTTATFGIFGTVTGGDFGATTRNFTGVFTAQFAGQTPEQVFNTVNTGGRLQAVGFSAEFVVAEATVIPEPSTYLLLGTGIAGLGLVGLRNRRRASGAVA